MRRLLGWAVPIHSEPKGVCHDRTGSHRRDTDRGLCGTGVCGPEVPRRRSAGASTEGADQARGKDRRTDPRGSQGAGAGTERDSGQRTGDEVGRYLHERRAEGTPAGPERSQQEHSGAEARRTDAVSPEACAPKRNPVNLSGRSRWDGRSCFEGRGELLLPIPSTPAEADYLRDGKRFLTPFSSLPLVTIWSS